MGCAAVHITFNISFKKKRISYFDGKLLKPVCANSSSLTVGWRFSLVLFAFNVCYQGKIIHKSGKGTCYQAQSTWRGFTELQAGA